MRIYIINAFLLGALIYGYLETERRTGVVRRQSWGNVLVDPCKPFVNETEYESLFTGTGTTSTVLQPWSTSSSYVFCVLGLLLIYEEYGEGLAILLFGTGIGSGVLHADETDIGRRMDYGFSLLVPLYLGVLAWTILGGVYKKIALVVGGILVIIGYQYTAEEAFISNTLMYVIVGCVYGSGILAAIIKRAKDFSRRDGKTIGFILISGITGAVTKYVTDGYLEGTCKNIPKLAFRDDIIHTNWHIYSQYVVLFTHMLITNRGLENLLTEIVFTVGCLTTIVVTSIPDVSYTGIFITTISTTTLTLLTVVGKWCKKQTTQYSELDFY